MTPVPRVRRGGAALPAALLAVLLVTACGSDPSATLPRVAEPATGSAMTMVGLGQRYASLVTWTQAGEVVAGRLVLECRCAVPTESHAFEGTVRWRRSGTSAVALRLDDGRRVTGSTGEGSMLLRIAGGPRVYLQRGGEPEFRHAVEILGEPGGLRGHQRRAVLAQRALYRPDVDGDGRRDRAGLRWGHLPDPTVTLGRLVLTVRTAAGAADTWSARVGFVPTHEHADGTVGLPWLGVGDVDGLPGEELTLPTSMGASYVFEHVLAWRAGGLVVLPPPPSSYQWSQGGSVGTGESDWGCRHGHLVTYRAIPRRPPPDRYVIGYRTVVTEWAWSGGWQAVSVERGRSRGGNRPAIEDCWRNRDGAWW